MGTCCPLLSVNDLWLLLLLFPSHTLRASVYYMYFCADSIALLRSIASSNHPFNEEMTSSVPPSDFVVLFVIASCVQLLFFLVDDDL